MRARKRWRQADLAEAARMARSTLAEVEAGKRRLYVDEAVDICAALGCTLADLLAGDECADARKALGI
nr:helix-turn-helix transcriptional regulator [Knoellia sp. DB2414S]